MKEEEVEEIVKGVLRQGHREVHRVWMASDRPIKTKDKIKDRKIVQESSMPWDKAGYKTKLQEDLKDIRQKLSRVLSKGLDKSDSSCVEATSPVKCIEGSVLVDLCKQRSGKRGSGCDAPKSADQIPESADGIPKTSEGSPTPVTSPPSPPKLPRTEVRQYSWRNLARKEACFCIHILKPLQTEKEEERLKGKQIKEKIVKDLHKNREKTMASSCHSRQNSESDHPSYSVILNDRERENIEIGNMSPSENDRSTLTPLKAKEKVGKGRFKYTESLNYDVMADDDISNSDVINRDDNVNKPVARKRYARREQSLIPKIEFFKRISGMCSKAWINFALILVFIASVIRRGININSSERLRTAGLSSAIWQECEDINSHRTPPFHPRLLRAVITATTGFWPKSGSHIPKLICGKKKQQITRDGIIFKNTIRSDVTSLMPVTAPPWLCNVRSVNVC